MSGSPPRGPGQADDGDAGGRQGDQEGAPEVLETPETPPTPSPRRPGRFGGPRRLGDSLGTLVNRWGGGTDPAQVASVFSRWPEIAGPVLAEHVHPVRMAGDTLVVAADHPAWATRARAEGPAILRSVGQLAGTAPARLDVVVRRR